MVDVAQATSLYESGLSLHECAVRLGEKKGRVYGALLDAGVEMRPTGPAKGSSHSHGPAIAAALKGRTLSSKHRERIGAASRAQWDRMTPEQQQERILTMYKGRRFTNTSLERRVSAALTDAGIAFEEQQRVGPYVVDFLLEDGTVIEANGCYWHACKKCGVKDTRRRRFRDARRHRSILSRQPGLVVLWGHDDIEAIVKQLPRR